MKAHFRLARCLHELAWSQEAFECLRLFKQQFPDYAKSPACETLDRDIKASIFSQTEGTNKAQLYIFGEWEDSQFFFLKCMCNLIQRDEGYFVHVLIALRPIDA